MGHPVGAMPGAMPTHELEAVIRQTQDQVALQTAIDTRPLTELLYYDGRTSHMIVWEGDYQSSLPKGHPRKLQTEGSGFDVGTLSDRVREEVALLFEQGHTHELEPMGWEDFCDFINSEENHQTRETISCLRGVGLVFAAVTESSMHRGWVMSILEYAIQRAETARTK